MKHFILFRPLIIKLSRTFGSRLKPEICFCCKRVKRHHTFFEFFAYDAFNFELIGTLVCFPNKIKFFKKSAFYSRNVVFKFRLHFYNLKVFNRDLSKVLSPTY